MLVHDFLNPIKKQICISSVKKKTIEWNKPITNILVHYFINPIEIQICVSSDTKKHLIKTNQLKNIGSWLFKSNRNKTKTNLNKPINYELVHDFLNPIENTNLRKFLLYFSGKQNYNLFKQTNEKIDWFITFNPNTYLCKFWVSLFETKQKC